MTVNLIEPNNFTSIPRLTHLVVWCLNFLQHRFANPFDSTHESVFKIPVANTHSSILLDFRQLRSLTALLHFESSAISHHKEITEVILLKHLRAKVDVTMHINVLEFISRTHSHVQHTMFWNRKFCSILPLQITVDVLSKRQFQVCNMTITCVC